MKRFFKIASAILLALSITVPVFAEPYGDTSRFSDIDADNFTWARPYINSMADKGFISGYEDGTFRPDNDVTRQEALSLFARAMGSNKVSSSILDLAHDKYDSILRNYNLTWGSDDIAYLLYRGALKVSDLDTYLRDNEKNVPMKRYEAAIIITKAMGGENSALDQLGVVLDYFDVRDIPSNAIQYVAYATERGIMEGMGDNTFSPNTAVKRSQMAVMLSRTVDKTNYTFVQQKLADVDTATRTLTVYDSRGNEVEYIYNDDTVMKNMGEEVDPRDLVMNVDAILTLSGNILVSVDTLSSQPDATVSGRYVSYASSSGRTTIKITLDGESEPTNYECSENVSVMYEGTPATIRSFAKGDVLTLDIVNGKVARITGETKTLNISNAVVDSVNVDDEVSLTIKHTNKEYDGKTYPVSNDVVVKKNDVTMGLDSIYKGDKVVLTLEYGVIVKITATSTKKVVEGSIKSLTISNQSTMVVESEGQQTSYQIPVDVEIIINDEVGTLYDFRVNDRVKLTLDSNAITKIVATSTQESAGSVTGVVTGINASYGVISVLPDGSEDARQVFCKDNTTTFISSEGKTRKMKDVEVGQTVDVRGTVSNGVFVGKLLVIVSE